MDYNKFLCLCYNNFIKNKIEGVIMKGLNYKFILIYFITINFIGFITMYIDKYKAKHHKWRIRENTLLLIATLGGSIGSYLGMQKFRHKTKHGKFIYGIPFILFLHIIIIYMLF